MVGRGGFLRLSKSFFTFKQHFPKPIENLPGTPFFKEKTDETIGFGFCFHHKRMCGR